MNGTALRSILVASDLSEGSDVVVRAAAGVAEITGADLHMLHAVEPGAARHDPDAPPGNSTHARLLDAATALRDQMVRVVPHAGHRVGRKVVVAPAAEAIAGEACQTTADLVVLGPHRRHGVVRDCLGSTADRVVRTSRAACLVVRDPVSLPLRRVVVPFDGSGPARNALEVALSWSVALGGDGRTVGSHPADVQVLHVVPRGFRAVRFPLDRVLLGPALHDAIAAARARIPGAGAIPVREEIVWGDDPAAEIVEYTGREAADLVVLGTHGAGAVSRALVGSVASAVARRARTPVLLVPPRVGMSERAGPDPSRIERPSDEDCLAVG